jgi:kumamolisin
MPNLDRQALPGSEREPAPGASTTGEQFRDEPLEVTVRLRSRTDMENVKGATLLTAEELGALPLKDRRYIRRSEYDAFYGPLPRDLAATRSFAARHNLQEVGSCAAGRSLKFRGSVSDMSHAFGTTLQVYKYPYGKYRGRIGPLMLPVDIVTAIQGVFGLDDRKQSKPIISSTGKAFQARSALDEIQARYAFPKDLLGRGQCIAILELGGSIIFDDLDTYFGHQGIPSPQIGFENVNASFKPNTDADADTELALDIEVAGSLAPGARIVCYFASNDEKGWIDGLCAAIHDSCNRPTVLAISWGAPEDWWETDKIEAVNQLLKDAAALGITVCAASGDSGCDINAQAFARVTFPASSPLLLACGGTSISANGTEVVWCDNAQSATGAGISDRLFRPNWQPRTASAVAGPAPRRINPVFDGRGLPDVAALASRCYSIYVHGGYQNGVGGTSAVAPLLSALIARLNEGLTKRGIVTMGYFNPLLYKSRSLQQTFFDVRDGNNAPDGSAGYAATDGWDNCTGWGSPHGESLLEELLKM